jgi:carbon storage regulator CsrA
MLVLTRKLQEKLHIGDDIHVTVVRLEDGQVRLGIEAPRHIRVVRDELVLRRRPDPAAGPSADPTAPADAPPTGIPPTWPHRRDRRGRGPSR